MVNSYGGGAQISLKDTFNPAAKGVVNVSWDQILESQAQAFDNNQPDTPSTNYTQDFKF